MNKRSSALRITAAALSACLAGVALIQSGGTAAAVQSSVAAISQQQSLQVGLRMASVDSVRIIEAQTVVDASQGLLASSENHTGGESTRQALGDAIAQANTDLTRTIADLGALPVGSDELGDVAINTKVARFVTATMHDLGGINTDLSNLAAAQSAVEVAVAARTAELQEAARRAAGSYHLAVWTSGFQTQLDACRGAVNLTGSYGVRVIGEKWECGGARFPHQGSLVTLSGIFAGVYRVGPTVAVLSAYADSTRDIPRGYALLYQTCRNGSARTETFAQLIPVG
jgi:hypothetical protein